MYNPDSNRNGGVWECRQCNGSCIQTRKNISWIFCHESVRLLKCFDISADLSGRHGFLGGQLLSDWRTFKKTKQICGDSAGEERTEMIDFRVARRSRKFPGRRWCSRAFREERENSAWGGGYMPSRNVLFHQCFKRLPGSVFCIPLATASSRRCCPRAWCCCRLPEMNTGRFLWKSVMETGNGGPAGWHSSWRVHSWRGIPSWGKEWWRRTIP